MDAAQAPRGDCLTLTITLTLALTPALTLALSLALTLTLTLTLALTLTLTPNTGLHGDGQVRQDRHGHPGKQW